MRRFDPPLHLLPSPIPYPRVSTRWPHPSPARSLARSLCRRWQMAVCHAGHGAPALLQGTHTPAGPALLYVAATCDAASGPHVAGAIGSHVVKFRSRTTESPPTFRVFPDYISGGPANFESSYASNISLNLHAVGFRWRCCTRHVAMQQVLPFTRIFWHSCSIKYGRRCSIELYLVVVYGIS